MTKRLTGLITAFVLMFSQLIFVPAAHAAMVGNDVVIQQQDRAELKARVMQVMDHKAAAQTLEKYGVDKDQISQRLDRLSHQELQQLAQKTDELPAGQSVLGAVVLILLILIVLDLLGATDIFPAI